MASKKTKQTAPAAQPQHAASRMLMRGDEGQDVKDLQQLLVAAGYGVGRNGIDGVFGIDTHNALRAFQDRARLPLDGIARKQTVLALGGTWYD